MPDMSTEPIKYNHMGTEECPIDLESEDLYFNDTRIGEIKGLQDCIKTKVISTLFKVFYALRSGHLGYVLIKLDSHFQKKSHQKNWRIGGNG